MYMYVSDFIWECMIQYLGECSQMVKSPCDFKQSGIFQRKPAPPLCMKSIKQFPGFAAGHGSIILSYSVVFCHVLIGQQKHQKWLQCMEVVETLPEEDSQSYHNIWAQAMPEHLMVKWHQWQNNPLHMHRQQAAETISFN